MKYNFYKIYDSLFYRGAKIEPVKFENITISYKTKICSDSNFYGYINIEALNLEALKEAIDQEAQNRNKRMTENKTLFCCGSSNWNYYFKFDETGKAIFYSIPKLDQLTCGPSYFGDLKHVLNVLDDTERATITAAGKALINAKGQKENYIHIIAA